VVWCHSFELLFSISSLLVHALCLYFELELISPHPTHASVSVSYCNSMAADGRLLV
jgi:hypothetical protein